MAVYARASSRDQIVTQIYHTSVALLWRGRFACPKYELVFSVYASNLACPQ
jgi:hypothetical protein